MTRTTMWRHGWMVSLCLIYLGCGGGGGDAAPKSPADSRTGADTKTAAAPTRTDAPGSMTPGSTGTAVIRGVVRFEGPVPKLKTMNMDADPGCAKKHASAPASEVLVLGEDGALGNVLVQVKGASGSGSYPAPAESAVLDQEGCRYRPHVIGLMVDQPLVIKNSDGLLHNVHALPQINSGFNQAMPGSVTESEKRFAKPEPPFKIKCDVHPWMGAYVAVFDHPFFDVTDEGGTFTIASLPAGVHEVVAWHEKLGTREATVEVSDDESENVELIFSR